MHDLLAFVLAGFLGSLLGLAFFGSLWWTVQAGLNRPTPAALFLVSSPLRLAAALAVFHWIGGHDWHKLLASLVGFSVVRIALIAVPSAPLLRRVRMKGMPL